MPEAISRAASATRASYALKGLRKRVSKTRRYSSYRAVTVSIFGLSKADFHLRTCNAARCLADVRGVQLTALPKLKTENRVLSFALTALLKNGLVILRLRTPPLGRHPELDSGSRCVLRAVY